MDEPLPPMDPSFRARALIHDAGVEGALEVARVFERVGAWHGVVDAIIDHIAAVDIGCI